MKFCSLSVQIYTLLFFRLQSASLLSEYSPAKIKMCCLHWGDRRGHTKPKYILWLGKSKQPNRNSASSCHCSSAFLLGWEGVLYPKHLFEGLQQNCFSSWQKCHGWKSKKLHQCRMKMCSISAGKCCTNRDCSFGGWELGVWKEYSVQGTVIFWFSLKELLWT